MFNDNDKVQLIQYDQIFTGVVLNKDNNPNDPGDNWFLVSFGESGTVWCPNHTLTLAD